MGFAFSQDHSISGLGGTLNVIYFNPTHLYGAGIWLEHPSHGISEVAQYFICCCFSLRSITSFASGHCNSGQMFIPPCTLCSLLHPKPITLTFVKIKYKMETRLAKSLSTQTHLNHISKTKYSLVHEHKPNLAYVL